MSGVTGYTIQFSTSPAFTSISHTGSPVASAYTPTVDLPLNTTVYWRVQTRAVNGPSTWSEVRTLITPTTPPGVPVLSLPLANTFTYDYTPTFSWQTVSGTGISYIIQVDDNVDFSSPVLDQSSTVPTFTPGSNLPSNAVLYWRVRAKNSSNILGNWSVTLSLRTAITRPTLTLPTHGSVSVSRTPFLDWTDVPGNNGYVLQLWKAGATPTLVYSIPIPVDISQYQFTTVLLPDTAYFWKVQTTGVNGPSLWTPSFTFTTGP